MVVGATVVVVGATVVVVGATGTATTAAEEVPVPPAFVPATVKVYGTPLESPTTRKEVAWTPNVACPLT